MKHIRDILKMTASDLERVSTDERIEIPEELHKKVADVLPRSSSRRIWLPVGAAAAVLLVAGIWGTHREPVLTDTYSDPYLAYAEVEKAFGKFSQTISAGVSSVEMGGEVFQSKIVGTFNSK